MLSLGLVVVLVVALATFLLGFVTLASNRSRLSNRVFGALCAFSGAYTLANYFADHDQVRALFWTQSTFFLAAFMLLFLLLFLNNLSEMIVKNSAQVIFSIVSLTASAMAYFPNFLSVHIDVGKTEVVPGPAYATFILYVVIYLAACLLVYARSYKKSRNLERVRMKYIAAGFGVTVALLLATNLVLPLITGNNDLSVLAPYFFLFFIGTSTYAIVRQRLFNIRLIVARSLAYLSLLLLLGVVFAVAILGISRLLLADEGESLRQSATSAVLALILAFTFQPLRRFFERITENLFYRDRYDSQQVLNDFTGILVSELDLDRILKKSLTTLCERLHIQFGQIIVFNNDRAYRIEHYGPLPQRLMVAPELRRLNRSMLIADELEGGERKTLLEGHGVRVSLMLSTRDQFVGYLLLGDKLSGDIYSNQDIALLEIIRKELAVAILNAKAYAEIQAFNVTLQARVDHATNRLRVANRHLQELDKAKDEFISMASHQLRTPLTTIKGYLSMMLEGDAGPISPSQKDFVQFAFDASERMVNLISDLLNISRLNAGRFLIQRTPTDMVQMIGEEVHQLQNHADAKGIKLVFEKPDHPLPPAEIDENKTRQVIMNFIDNAIYYTQKGQVKVTLEQTGDMVHLEVHDTGIGVPEAARRKLFTKFYRAENAQTVRPDGTGLGLYLAKRVIQDQDGTIIFNSVEGKGSTFGFELPFKPKPKPVKHEDKKKQHA